MTAQTAIDELAWKCCGCGIASPDRIRVCECPTDSVYISGTNEFELKRESLPTLRCDGCDNGLEEGWTYCPWCARRIEPEEAA